MQKLKKGDFVNYKLKVDNIPIGYKMIPIEIIKIPKENYSLYELSRLDNESIDPKELSFIKDYETIEIGNHHFEGLKAKLDLSYFHPMKNCETKEKGHIMFLDFIIENLRFIQIYLPNEHGNQILRDRFFLLKNSNLKKQDYFKHFFKSNEDGIFDLKVDNENDEIERISNINELFELLDSINYSYNKKEIILLKEPKK